MNKAEIDLILTAQVEKHKTPSVQYIIFDKDRIIHRFQAGLADIKGQIEAVEPTTINAFSTTKTFTALAVLQLAEKNLLDIHDAVEGYLPAFPYSPDITIRQLLTHSSGIPNPNPLPWIHLEKKHQTFDRNKFFEEIFNKYKKTKSGPNEKFAYSNLGYVFLGQIIEAVSGQTYEEYIRDNILKPLAIHPEELDFEINDSNQHAKGYQKKNSLLNWILGFFIDKTKYMDKVEGGWKPFKAYYINGTPYGGLVGNPDGFQKYIQELLKPDCILVSNESKEMLFTENLTNAGKKTGMCLSWFRGELNGQEYFAHAGGGGGYYCEIRIYPELGIGSVIMFNRTGVKDERFLNKLDVNYIR
jgi:CubicO group peptidase (beta-lactamase class C family)